MSRVQTTPEAVEVRLAVGERVAGLLRDLRVPREAVTAAEAVDDGLRATRGLRAPGLGLPGIAKIGTWRGRHDRQYVVARRGVPALLLNLAGQRYDRVVVSTPDAQRLARELAPR